MKIPASHPRKASLEQRRLLEEGVRQGVTGMTGLIAFGRGEAFDYFLGEKTTKWAEKAAEAAAALLLLAKNPVISVNGNTAALCPRELIALARAVKAKIEVNLFYRTREREAAIKEKFRKLGFPAIGTVKDARIPGLESERAKVSRRGIFSADVVLVPLEDGDRAQALKKMGKTVIAVDLNPLSRTARAADVTIVDNVVRAVPEIAGKARKMKHLGEKSLHAIASRFDNKKNLRETEKLIRKGI